MIPQEIIRRKRNKQILSKEEIDSFVEGITSEDISDAQIAAMTMAMFLNGLSGKETVDLTLSMRDSGDVLKWNFDAPVVDKHSTGGVGDKVSLVLGPILAACGLYVPMISGRGLGHTGGTLDKLDSVEGYQTTPSNELFKKTVQEAGCAIIGQTQHLAPADKRIYAVRDVCATVESIPLITASILSKKLAAGLDCLVMDVKCGNGAFMENEADAANLADSIVRIANTIGTKTSALLTDMNSVLGKTVGNALEVFEAVEYLKGQDIDSRFDEVTKALCVEALLCSKVAANSKEALSKVEKVLKSGAALERFSKMVALLGGPADFVEHPKNYMSSSPVKQPVFANKEGYVSAMNTRDIGLLLVELKGSRTHPLHTIDHATGFSCFCQLGDKVDTKTPIVYVHAQNSEQAAFVARKLQEQIIIGERPAVGSAVLRRF
ncbi:MAG: thymidine phosphorylase [Alphaproteobacteria bacterium]|nr:thymidine phosphorylase [Alphaproteobacteria bacterium]